MRVGVLGAGPAAGAAAAHLARTGAAVTLFRPQRPGEKPCGGALPEFLLREVEGFDPAGLPSVRSPIAVLENAAHQSLSLELAGLRIYRRRDFDPALVEAARRQGARVVDEKARRIGWAEDLPFVDTDTARFDFDWVIGADGARGLSRRTLGLEPEGESVGLGRSLIGTEPDRLVLGFPRAADSYLWIFPRPGGCSVGIAFSPEKLPDDDARGALDKFLDRHLGAGLDRHRGSSYRYPIPVYGAWTSNAIACGLERRVLLVGDAAGVADPLTREGIRYAVRSGQWAAAALAEGAPDLYSARLTRSLEAELSRAERARELFFEGYLGQWMVPVAKWHPGVRRVLGDLLGCRQSYTGLRRRLLRAAVGLSGSTSGWLGALSGSAVPVALASPHAELRIDRLDLDLAVSLVAHRVLRLKAEQVVAVVLLVDGLERRQEGVVHEVVVTARIVRRGG